MSSSSEDEGANSDAFGSCSSIDSDFAVERPVFPNPELIHKHFFVMHIITLLVVNYITFFI